MYFLPFTNINDLGEGVRFCFFVVGLANLLCVIQSIIYSLVMTMSAKIFLSYSAAEHLSLGHCC